MRSAFAVLILGACQSLAACQSSVALDDVVFACKTAGACDAAGADGAVVEAKGADAEASGADAEASDADAEANGADAEANDADAEAKGADAEANDADAEANGADAEANDADAEADGAAADADALQDAPLCTATSCKDDNPCTGDACDPSKGCVYLPVAGTCSDGDQCTVDDQCSGGACVPGPKFACDDQDPCTADSCETGKGCLHAPQEAPCNDGDACTSGDFCSAGKCGGKPVTCDDKNPCTDDTCDKKDGCGYAVNGKPCDDGNDCTSKDTCTPQGFCAGSFTCACKAASEQKDCDDKNPCTTDTCSADFKCSSVPKPSGACDDGKPCTTADACDGKGGCAGKAVDCSSLDGACVAGVCDAVTGGKCVAQVKNALCNDGDVCTVNDQCEAGKCKPGALKPCDDGNQCTTDACDKTAGCTATPKPANTCDDGNGCTKDTCDAKVGCKHDPADGAPCSDNNACTTGDGCQGGACTTTGNPACVDGNPCTDDLCDWQKGCTPTPNSAPCESGQCTAPDQCSGGACKAGKDAKLFDRVYGGALDEEAEAVLVLPDGFALGGYGSVTGNNEDLLLLRTDLAGNPLWQKNYGSASAERMMHEAGLCKPATGGGFALAGYRVVGVGVGGAEVTDGFAVRTDDAGKELWQKTFGGGQNDHFFTCTANADGGLLLAGQTASKGEGELDGWLLKLDEAGLPVFDVAHGGAKHDRFVIALPAGDGGFLGAGLQTGANNDGEFWALRMDAAGKALWSKTYGKGPSYETVHDAVMLPDGSWLLGGATNFGGVEWNLHFVRIDASGNKLWEQTKGTPKHDFLFDLMLRPDGRIVYTGANGWTTNALNEGDGLVGLLDANGGFYWQRGYESAAHDQLRHAASVGDGTMVLAGHKAAGNGHRDLRLMRVDVNGAPTCAAAGVCSKAPACDDGSPCTFDQCDPVKGCTTAPAPDGLACEAGACSVLDTCSKGTCVASGKARQFAATIGSLPDEELAAVVARPGGFTLVGRTGAAGKHDLQLTKIDASGKVVALATVESGGDVALGGGQSLVRFAVVGYAFVATRTKQGGSAEAWVVRTDGAGKPLWQLDIGGGKPDQGWSLAAHPNEAVVVAGELESDANGPSDGFVARVTPAGKVQWQKAVGSVSSDGLRAVVVLPGGGSVAVGRLGSVQGDNTAMVAVRHDDAGGFGWQTTVPAQGQDMAQAVALADDGGVWLAGRTGSAAAFDTRVVRLNASGNVLWDRTLAPTSKHDHARGIALTDDGGAVLAGATNAVDPLLGGEGWLVRLDALGNVAWARTFAKTGNEVLRGVMTLPDAGFLAVGGIGPAGDRDDRVVRTDAWGHASCVPTCAAKEPAMCQDSNPCTADQCGAGKGCFFTPLSDGSPCGKDKKCAAGQCK